MILVSLRLATRQWRAKPLRPTLCALAIAAAVMLVVCIGAGFDSARASLLKGVGQLLGNADVHVRAAGRGLHNQVPVQIETDLRKDPAVAIASGRMESQLALSANGNTRWVMAVGVEPKTDEELRPKKYLSGQPVAAPDDLVLDESVAALLKVKVGDSVQISTYALTQRPAKVVGLVARPQIEMLQKPTCFLPVESLSRDINQPAAYNVIDLRLRDGDDARRFSGTLGKKLGAAYAVAPAGMAESQLQKQTEAFNLAVTAITILGAICAALIIGTTLSVGVQERVRQYGQLRCIGAARGHLMLLLASEAVLLMTVGSVLGLLAGWGGSWLLVRHFDQFFSVYKLGGWSIGNAAATGVIATVLGFLIPGWEVWRITPMAAVQSTGKAARPRAVWTACAMGLLLLGTQVALWQIPNRDVRFWCYLFLGVPFVFCGYALLGPALVLLVERWGASAVGGLLAVRPALLRQAWSRTPWRAGGMIAALMIGITLFTAVRTRSQGLMATLRFPAKFPDLFLYSFYAIPEARAHDLPAKVPDVVTTSGIIAFPATLKREVFLHKMLPDNQTLFVCIEPDTFPKLVSLEFVQGNEADAFAQLAKGQAILVSEEYNKANGIGLGDVIPLETPDKQTVSFTVVGVVRSPGMDAAKHYFDMRGAFQNAAVSSVIGSLDDGKKYFGIKGITMILADVKRNRPVDQVISDIRPRIATFGLQSASSIEMKESITTLMRHVADAVSLIALAAMGVASLGVANMVISSVQARQYEFGVLRAVGAGRGQLMRLVLAETVLAALVAAVLGTAAGLHLAFMGTLVDRTVIGLQSRYVVSWEAIATSWVITLALGLLAALLPAVRVALLAQRSLLASGRT